MIFNLELPIIQAPMAGVQGSALTVAVSNAGGLGSLPCATLSLEQMREELIKIKAQTNKPFNVNFFCHVQPALDIEREKAWRAALLPYYHEFDINPANISSTSSRLPFTAEAAELISKFEPPVVSFHFGLPSPDLLNKVRTWDAKIISTATTVDEALWLESRGVDAIIAQGLEAGGHRGHFLSDNLSLQSTTFVLLSDILNAVKIPVIAAGGIANTKEAKKALELGATAVQIGTTYLLCPETTTSSLHRAAITSPRQTTLTNVFTGRPARGIMNRLMLELGSMNLLAPEFPLAASALAPLRIKAELKGHNDFSPLWSGENRSGCRNIPAAQLTRELAGKV